MLVVDEASMIDLPMMSRLIDALPIMRELILSAIVINWPRLRLGLCWRYLRLCKRGLAAERPRRLTRLTGTRVPAGTGTEAASLRDSLCLLQKSYRLAAMLALVGSLRQSTVVIKRQ
ncbi:hypothetical protein ACNKHV_17620 [Shigella flexneri]